MAEHFAELHEFGFAQLGQQVVLVNRTRDGQVQVFENPVFHRGGGLTLEMREFTENGLKAQLAAAGFSEIPIYCEHYLPFGIRRSESRSLPIAARKGPFALRFDSAREVLEEWRGLKQKRNAEMERLDRAFWFRLGRKLKFL